MPGLASVSNPNAPPALVKSPPTSMTLPDSHQYAGGAQLYGPSFEPDGPSRAELLYSADAICGSAQSAARNAAR